MRPERIAWAAALIVCAALLAAPWRGHVDDFDAQIHTVVARNLARDHSWVDLRYLPTFDPVFRDHLPFGFWPAAAAIRVAGERAINPVYALMMLGAIAVSGAIARRVGGAWAGVAAILLLGTCESIWQYGGRLLLEPPLLLFATAAAGAALAGRWGVAGVFGAVATLIKGPFGLLPLLCVAMVRWRERRAALAVLGAMVPLAVFLAVDPGGEWRTGYLHGQLLASASGGRGAGVGAWWFPLAVVVRRFWPGFPFLIVALWQARRNAAIRPLLYTCALVLAALCLPQRKWGNHSYVVFPLLGALAGVAASALLERASGRAKAAGAAALAVAAVAVSASGLGARVLRPPCPFSTVLADALRRVPGQTPLAVVAGDRAAAAAAVVALAAERDLLPSLETSVSSRSGSTLALIHEGVALEPPWHPIAGGGGWILAERAASTSSAR